MIEAALMKSASDKVALMLEGGVLGGLIGAAEAPQGNAWRGAGRGMAIGAGTGLGTGLGATAGVLGGAAGGFGLGSLTGNPALAGLGMAAGGLMGGIGGAGLGGVASYRYLKPRIWNQPWKNPKTGDESNFVHEYFRKPEQKKETLPKSKDETKEKKAAVPYAPDVNLGRQFIAGAAGPVMAGAGAMGGMLGGMAVGGAADKALGTQPPGPYGGPGDWGHVGMGLGALGGTALGLYGYHRLLKSKMMERFLWNRHNPGQESEKKSSAFVELLHRYS